MTTLRVSIVSAALALTSVWCTPGEQGGGERPWSVRIARSFLAMHPDSIIYHDEAKSRKWNYEQGLMLEAFYQTWMQSGDSLYLTYMKRNLDYYVADDGTIRTYKLSDFNLDNIAPGKGVVRLYAMTGQDKYRKAADVLRDQLRQQPRTRSGGFWHKKIYPFQMWLDGLYMAEPFYTLYAATFGEKKAFDDIAHQFLLIEKNNRDEVTGLYYHGWDESRSERWADQQTGRSASFWGRSIGWFAMALVDVLELFPADHPGRSDLKRIFEDLARSVLQYREDSTGLWFQVIDKPGGKGNYLEASASAMFAYALAKGARLGYLPAEMGVKGMESFTGLLKHLTETGDDGVLHLLKTVKVGGLGGRPYRDGSYDYYLSEPTRMDDFKGYGPFLLAAIETERLSEQLYSGDNEARGKGN